MERVLIGAPIYKREWILKHWFRCIEEQTHPLDHIGFIFELGPDDSETHAMLWDWHSRHPEVIYFDGQIDRSRTHSTHPEGKRNWNTTKYANMVAFRNTLLDRATVLSDRFDYYFSLDSDLLLEYPGTISKLIDDCQQPNVDVVSPLSYMTATNKSYPSIMYWEGKSGHKANRRHDLFQANSLYEVDIVMAAVFMKRKVFTRTRYWPHPQGEDLGFAVNLLDQGFHSFADTSLYANHIMHKASMQRYLDHIPDPRKPEELV